MVTDFGNGEALRACKPGDAGEALVELLGLGCSAGAWADHGAGATSGIHEAVGYELVVGLLDRGRVDTEVGCETANWIELVAVTELTVSDGRNYLVVDLFKQWDVRVRAKGDEHAPSLSVLFLLIQRCISKYSTDCIGVNDTNSG